MESIDSPSGSSSGVTALPSAPTRSECRSDVWQFFEANNSKQRAVCRLCARSFVYKSAVGTTSNLRKHLASQHASHWEQHRASERTKTSTQWGGEKKKGPLDLFVRKMTCAPGRAGQLTDAIVDMVALDLRPCSFVSGAGFQKLMNLAEPGYRVPSKTHITTLLGKKHVEGRTRLKKLLSSASAVALTTDMWTSRATEGYLTATVHFISDEWKMCSFVLETAGFVKHHTGENIGKRLVDIADSFEITSKVVSLTHDEAANQCAAIREACKLAVTQHKDASWKSLVCAAHRLQSCIRYALDVEGISDLLKCSRKLVGHFRHSCKASQALKEKQQEDRARKRIRKVIQDVPTRWNSSYYMLERLIDLRMPIIAVLTDKNISKQSDAELDLTAHQWLLADSLVTVLKPFELATTLLSAEENVSLSCILPIMEGLNRGVRSSPNDILEIKQCKAILNEQLTQRFELDSVDAASLPVLASLLDPRFKNAKFFPDPADKQEAQEALLALIKEAAPSDTTATVQTPGSPPEKRCDKGQSPWDIVGVEFDSCGVSDVKQTEEDELKQYFDEEPLPRHKNPLDWWKVKSSTFPRLSIVARRTLCITATSTPAERVFSVGGLVANQQRATLSPANLDAIVFLNKNVQQLFDVKFVNTAEPVSMTETMRKPETTGVDTDSEPDLPQLDEWDDV